jgi:hypothetical protein
MYMLIFKEHDIVQIPFISLGTQIYLGKHSHAQNLISAAYDSF